MAAAFGLGIYGINANPILLRIKFNKFFRDDSNGAYIVFLEEHWGTKNVENLLDIAGEPIQGTSNEICSEVLIKVDPSFRDKRILVVAIGLDTAIYFRSKPIILKEIGINKIFITCAQEKNYAA